MKQIMQKSGICGAITVLLLSFLASSVVGCAHSGMRVEPIISSRGVLELSADDIVQIMRRTGFSDEQIVELGEDMRNGLAQSGAVQIRINKRVEVSFVVSGNDVYIYSLSRGSFVYNIKTGWGSVKGGG